MVCDEDILNRMLINLIVKGFKLSIVEKVFDKDLEIIEDFFKFFKWVELI